jgi:hypothetical protein
MPIRRAADACALRRTLVAGTTLVASLGVLVGLLGTPSGAVAPAAQSAAQAALTTARPDGRTDDRAVDRAEQVLTGRAGARQRGPGRQPAGADATLVMRDLFRARGALGFFDGIRAQVLLARPTDGRRDPGGDGYRRASERICDDNLCVHRVARGEDAATAGWTRRTLRVLGKVWRYEIGTLGFAPPPGDGKRGGDARFDVYLADLGARGLFGYCTPERRVKGQRFQASGYCVLDNDFAREQYRAPPTASLRVTAAHEFFHAVQFGYDFYEDPWFMESTATWIEERFADGSNDNRRFLRYGSVRHPGVPLDRFSNIGYSHYGNWAFWEFLTQRHGDRVVRRAWQHAGTRGRGDNAYSTQALERVLRDKGGVRRALTGYATANLTPATSYPEGRHWPRAKVNRSARLAPGRVVRERFRLDHLTAQHLRLTPPARGARWRLRVAVDGPAGVTSPAARLLVTKRDGRQIRRTIRLDDRGRGRISPGVWVNADNVRSVVVTVVNASTRFRCDKLTLYSCGGVPRDDDRRFTVEARIVRR